MRSRLQIKTVTGQDIQAYVSPLAALRISVFKEFPYLYDGSLAYEEVYLADYAKHPASFVVLVIDPDKPAAQQVVGASTAMPLLHADEEFHHYFRQHQDTFNLETIMYFGESILLPDYRGQGIGHLFFDRREQHALNQGADLTCFCAVHRPDNHPAKPENWQTHHAFWQKRGYTHWPDITANYDWKDIGNDQQTTKTLSFWLKQW